jgi:DNA polymerase-1
MADAYESGDPYLAFAKQAGAAPPDATKASHKAVREQFKACVLAVQYGAGAETLAQRIGQPLIKARELLLLHHETYRVFWPWSDAIVDHAMLGGSLHTVFGWQVQVTAGVNPRSLRNFPMQANGAEMLRLACCLATEQGIEVCAPVHDAVLICAPLDRLDADVACMREAMAEASRIVLDGFELGTDVNLVRYPERYMDEAGAAMWGRVMRLVGGQGL